MAIMQKVQGSSKKSKASSSSSGGGGGGGGNGNGGGGGADPVSSSTTKETVIKAGSSTTKKKTGPKTGHSRSYPRGVGLDFRKLAGLTLVSYIDHHGVKVRPEAPPSELAVAVARHFEQMEVDEEDVIGGFLERLEEGPTVATEYSRKTQRYPIKTVSSAADSSSKKAAAAAAKKAAKAGGGNSGKDGSKGGSGSGDPNSYKSNLANNDSSLMSTLPSASASTRIVNRKRTKWAARPGEQVAAKVTRTDENGSWILASVQRFYVDTETYDVQDEDDTSKLIRLPWSHVMRLSTGAEGCFVKSADCMAIFPETTSFYKSKVAKSPVWKLDHGVPCVKEIVVQFEDDEDTLTGKTPRRRVPSRYVIPTPSAYFYDEHEDVDLISPTLSNRTTTTSNSTTPTPSSTVATSGTAAAAATTTTVVPSSSTTSATVTSSTTVKK